MSFSDKLEWPFYCLVHFCGNSICVNKKVFHYFIFKKKITQHPRTSTVWIKCQRLDLSLNLQVISFFPYSDKHTFFGFVFFQLFWGITDKIVRYLKHTTWWFGRHCEGILPIKLLFSFTKVERMGWVWKKWFTLGAGFYCVNQSFLKVLFIPSSQCNLI